MMLVELKYYHHLSLTTLKIHFLYYLEGIAKLIFNRKHPNINVNGKKLDDGIIKCDMILTGTSWQSNIEYIAIEKAKKMNKYTISFFGSLDKL